MRHASRARVAVALALALAALSLDGCSIGPSTAQLQRQLESIATDHIVGLNGAFVSLSYEGSDRAILLVLYTKSGSSAVITRAISDGFRLMWKDSPFRPSSVAVGAAHRTKPAHPQTVDVDSVDPRPVATSLGIPRKYTTSTWIDLPENVLISRYGDRAKSSGS